MPELLYPALRCLHVLSLCTLFGAAVCLALFAAGALKSALRDALRGYQVVAVLLLMFTTVGIYLTQAGLMGDGPGDMINPQVLQAVAGTRFGSVWMVQGALAIATLLAMLLRMPTAAILLLPAGQLMLLAWTGHAAMNDGAVGAVQRLNHTLHLLCVAWWLGGLLPLLLCMRLAVKPGLQALAITAMQRFSLTGHLAVAGAIVTGALNALLIGRFAWHGFTPWFQLLLIKCALVAGMVAIALYNRYVLVPRFHASGAAVSRFIRMTQTEMLLGVMVIATVSLFATWAPF